MAFEELKARQSVMLLAATGASAVGVELSPALVQGDRVVQSRTWLLVEGTRR